MDLTEGLSESEKIYLYMLMDWQLENSYDFITIVDSKGQYIYIDIYYN